MDVNTGKKRSAAFSTQHYGFEGALERATAARKAAEERGEALVGGSKAKPAAHHSAMQGEQLVHFSCQHCEYVSCQHRVLLRVKKLHISPSWCHAGGGQYIPVCTCTGFHHTPMLWQHNALFIARLHAGMAV
jgi:hypothetical protein